MTDSSNIQQARDVLKKWRKQAAPGPWRFDADGPRYLFSADPFDEVADLTNGPAHSALIVGTAGNPDLLDAIDGMLGTVQRAPGYFDGTAFEAQVERLAAAIIAAEGRM